MRRKLFKTCVGAAGLVAFSSSGQAGTFTADFNDGQVPAGSAIYGSTLVETTGGVSDSGAVKITKASNSLQGSFVVDDLDAGEPVNSFDLVFKIRVGGGTATPADGFSICVASDLPAGGWGEEGIGSGLRVAGDTYVNGDVGETSPAVTIRWGDVQIAELLVPIATLRTGDDFVDARVRMEADGTLDVWYKGSLVFSNLAIPQFQPITGAKYGWGARTGGLNDNHFIDDLSITTTTGPKLLVFSVSPQNIRALSGRQVTFRSQVNDSTLLAGYRWFRKGATDADFSEIPGADQAEYTTPILSTDDNNAQYRVQAIGVDNDADSDIATLLVEDIILPAPVASFNFNDGQVPANTAVFTNATVTPDGGVDGGGVLRLTEAENDRNGLFIVNDLNSGQLLGGLVATFQLQMGPGSTPPADGFGFSWANDIADNIVAAEEEGTGTGLIVAFDTYDNVDGNPNNANNEAPAVEVKWNGQVLASRQLPLAQLSTGTFAEVIIRVQQDGTVDVAHNGEFLHWNVPIPNFAGIAQGRFAFGARTGGANEAHYVDDITLATELYTGPMKIVTELQNRLVLANQPTTLSVTVNNPAQATFQWQRKAPGAANFANIAGANTTSYTTPVLTLADTLSQYRLIATGSANSATSQVATLTVVNLARPTTDLDLSYNFDDGVLPADTRAFGHAVVTATGGVADSGVLHLTDAVGGQSGSFLMDKELEGGRAVEQFTAAFKMKVDAGSGAPADGFSFNWAADLPEGTVGDAEEGAGSGLRVCFDTYDNDTTTNAEAPAISIKWRGVVMAEVKVPYATIGTEGNYADTLVRLSPNGTVDLAYDNQVIFHQVVLTNFVPIAGAKFMLAARTGGEYENHWVDDIAIQTVQAAVPVIVTQPSNLVLVPGFPGTLNVQVNDPLAVTYQWQQKAPGDADFVNIADATSESFTTEPFTTAQSGTQYRVLMPVDQTSLVLTSQVATVITLEIPLDNPTVAFDFEDGATPDGTLIFGNAAVVVGDIGGAVHLTDAVASQAGSFIITNDIADGAIVDAVTVRWKALISGGGSPPADGTSFAWGRNIGDAAFGEDGSGSDLVLSIDTYDNVDADPNNNVGEAPAFELIWRGTPVATNKVALDVIRTEEQFVQAIVRIEGDGTVDVIWDNRVIFHNVALPGFSGIAGARFAWGARTGGAVDNHWIDDVSVTIAPALQDVTAPGDAITSFGGNSPANEPVANAINNTMQKYLNFGNDGDTTPPFVGPVGLIVTPAMGATVVNGLRIYTANDAVDRDPADYILEGSMNGGATYQLIASGALALPATRNAAADPFDPVARAKQEVRFVNATAYTSYRLTFTNVKNNTNVNSMQVGEIELLGVAGTALPVLSVARQGANAVITYTGILESAPAITGPWTTVPGASSPHTTPATGNMFFRSRQ